VQLKPILDENQLDKYISKFEHLVNKKLPKEYYRNNLVYGYFSESGELMGGFTFAYSNLRGIALLPEQITLQNEFLKNNPQDKLFEINGLWLDPRIISSLVSFYLFWHNFAIALNRVPKKYVLIWYNNTQKNINKLYSRVTKKLIYKGKTNKDSQIDSHDNICVYYTTKWRIQYSIFSFIPMLVAISLRRVLLGFTSKYVTKKRIYR